MDFILDHLAIGSAEDAWQRPPEVDAMLCVADEIDLPPWVAVGHKVPVRDMHPIPATQLAEALAWIDRHVADRRILVFCNAGVGRSTSAVVGYLCCRRGYGFGEAVEYVARRRPYMSILPNLLLTIEELQRAGGCVAGRAPLSVCPARSGHASLRSRLPCLRRHRRAPPGRGR